MGLIGGWQVRVNSTQVPRLDWAFNKWVVGPTKEWHGYYIFANVQKAIDQVGPFLLK
jgi:hypothetical protein